MILGRTILAAVLWTVPTYGWAQAIPSKINDCTFLTDPTDLRYCLFIEQGGRPAFPVTILSNGEDPSSIGSYYRHGGYHLATPNDAAPPARSKVRVRLGFAESATVPQQFDWRSTAKPDRYRVHIEQVSDFRTPATWRSPDRRNDIFIRQINAR